MEEIKINGIDVSECEYINCCSKKAKCIILQDDILSDSQYCESEPNCYYKQFKRLEQENAELKERKDKYYQRTLDLEIIVSEYQQALEEIREMAKNSYSIPCANGWCDCENCKDKITNNGETCMQYGLDKIINKINEVLK